MTIDLHNWKITLPVDSSGNVGGSSATEIKPPQILTFEKAPWFVREPDGDLVFRANVDGATTSGSKYPRSELREMNGTSLAAWKLGQGGTMTATLEIDAVPDKFGGGPNDGRVVVGQIHGPDDELVRLYWEGDTMYFMNDKAGPGNSELRFDLKNAAGQKPNVSLDEVFSYKIDAHGDTLFVDVFADGQHYSTSTKINAFWNDKSLYFKAGMYVQVNETMGTGFGQATFHDLVVSHDGSAPPPPPPPVDPSPPPPPPPPPAPPAPKPAGMKGTDDNDIITGTSAADQIRGRNGDDAIDGGAGNDRIEGNEGNDRIAGGVGADVIKGSAGHDTFVFRDIAEAGDTITDFKRFDFLDLSAMHVTTDHVHLSQAGLSVHVHVDDVLLATLTGAKLAEVSAHLIV